MPENLSGASCQRPLPLLWIDPQLFFRFITIHLELK
ncbi:Uncharacterized protein APZ42_008171 [Daphnia magna]|uniref:Uncharacterized protein n=1 Tax=Daphnia magna TaxID=35525 RepID=A0A164ETW6_9CRUS|nr:Uncharacterized protein APZ42_008171 [Daphnia magna]